MTPWVPIAKEAAVLLPNNRPFTRLEALFSLQSDHNGGNEVSIMGMARRWDWSRKRVRTFLNRVGVEISYPKTTKKYRNQRGHITVHKKDISAGKKGHITFINFNTLQPKENICPQEKGHKGDISGATTIKKEKENKEITAFSENAVGGNGDCYRTKKGKQMTGWKLKSFNDFWTVFNWKKGKAEAADAWFEIPNLDGPLLGQILSSAKAEARRRPGMIEKGRSPKWAQGWLSGRRWEDEQAPINSQKGDEDPWKQL